jgi:hypothetical protein
MKNCPKHVALALIVTLVAVTPASAWGPDGHLAVARIAQARLTPAAQAAILSLLGRQAIVDVAVWADEVRNTTHPQTYNWHFTDVPLDASAFNRARDCKPNTAKGDCSVAALERLTAVLRDTTKPPAARKEALMFIVHIVGDLHQPLHSAERNHDRGGNDVMVAEIGRATNLHAAWDSGIIRASGRDDRSLAAAAEQWLMSQNEAAMTTGSFVDWTNEGHKLSREFVYVQVSDHRISNAERVDAIRIIEKRIARAGVRLADVLNRAFAT